MERTDFEQWRAKEVSRLLALVETERRYYQEMVAAVPMPLVVVAEGGNVTWANRAFRHDFQLRTEDLRNKKIDEVLPVVGLMEWLEGAQAQGASPSSLAAVVGGRPLKLSAIPMRNWDSEADAEVLVTISPQAELSPVAKPEASPSITEPQPSPASAAAEPAQAATVVPEPLAPTPIVPPPSAAIPADTPVLYWEADAETLHFQSVEGSVQNMLGYPASHWTTHDEFFAERMHPEDRVPTMELYKAAIASRRDATAEFRSVTADGASVWCRELVHCSPNSGRITGILTEIGRRRQAEQQTLTAGRMDALQALAGRLAHDLNNPLMIINGYGEEMLHSLGAANPLRGDLTEILGATQRIARVAARMTEFARKQANPAEGLDVGNLLHGMEAEIADAAMDSGSPYELLDATTTTAGKSVVKLDMIANPEPVWAMANADQLREVILAVAAPHHDGAQERTRLTVTCQVETIVDRTPSQILAPGKYTRITLRDDGRGVESDRQASIFEPEFTAAGSMSLARAYTLVRQWNGDIVFASEPFRGSTFAIYLPYAQPPYVAPPIVPDAVSAEVATPEVAGTAVPETTPDSMGSAPQGQSSARPAPAPIPEPEPEPMRETILVVDDEAGIRGLMRKILRRERYAVLEAASAEEALVVAAAAGRKINLLLTDVMLPGLQGPDLARRLYQADPELKVLYISGYTEDEGTRAGDYPPGSKFLAKPFTLGALLSNVRDTLDINIVP